MKIAVFHNLPSGGGKRALHEQVRRLAQRHTVDVYTLSCAEHGFGDLRPHCREHRIYPFQPGRLYQRPIGRLNQGVRTLDLVRLDRLYKRIAQDIDRETYDVVAVALCQYMVAPSILAGIETPSVYYCQEPPRKLYEPPVPRPQNELGALQRFANLFDPLPGQYRRTLRRLDRTAARSASLALVNSHYSRETYYRVYGRFARVAYLGVDTDLFRPLGLGREDYVLSVGALNPAKGYDFLLRSLACIEPRMRPPLRIACNSEGPGERVYLERLAAELEVSLTIETLVTDQELVALYNRARLVVYAPVMEPFGFVPLEAMSCGTPVVGVREAGVRESVADGVTGLLTDRDPIVFADAVRSLLLCDGRREDLAMACREHVMNKWSWQNSVEKLEAYLESAASQEVRP